MQLSEMFTAVLTVASEVAAQGVDPEVSFDVSGRFATLKAVELSDDRRHVTIVLEAAGSEDG